MNEINTQNPSKENNLDYSGMLSEAKNKVLPKEAKAAFEESIQKVVAFDEFVRTEKYNWITEQRNRAA